MSYRKAEQAVRRAVELEPENTLYLNNWGDLLLKLKRYDNAEEAYRRAIKLTETWRSYIGLAKVYINLGDKNSENWMYEEALSHLYTVSELYPEITTDTKNKKDYYYQSGYTHAKLGHWREAERNFLQCYGDPKAERNIRRIRNRLSGQRRPPKAQVAGGRALAGISVAGLTTSFILFFIKFEGIKPITPDLLKVLVPTFLTFIALGFALPYIRTVRGPGGMGFEKEITIRPESASPEIQLEYPPR